MKDNKQIISEHATKEKTDRNKKLIKMKEQGFSYNKLAEIFHITPQRVYAILKKSEKNLDKGNSDGAGSGGGNGSIGGGYKYEDQCKKVIYTAKKGDGGYTHSKGGLTLLLRK